MSEARANAAVAAAAAVGATTAAGWAGGEFREREERRRRRGLLGGGRGSGAWRPQDARSDSGALTGHHPGCPGQVILVAMETGQL